MSSATDRLELIAYHEAGHAVIALVLGLNIGRRGVTIIPDKTSVGSTDLPRFWVSGGFIAPRTHVRIENYAVAYLAGPAAQDRFRPRSRFRGHSDLDQAADLLGCISESSRVATARLDVAIRRARHLVGRHWSDVVAVAGALIEHRILSMMQVQEVLRRSIPPQTEKHDQERNWGKAPEEACSSHMPISTLPLSDLNVRE